MGTSLNENERSVLYGLVAYQGEPDRVIADNLDMKRSTVTMIRNRLLSEGLVDYHYLPNFSMFKDAVYSIHSCTLHPIGDHARFLRKFHASDNGASNVYYLSSARDLVYLNVTEDFTRSKKNIMDVERIDGSGAEKSIDRIKNIYLPASISTPFLFFDFEKIIQEEFRLESINNAIQKPKKVDSPALRVNEKRIFLELVKNPKNTDSEIAGAVSTSRQSVVNFKKRALEKNWLSVKIIPDLKKLGYSLIAFSHTRYNPEKPMEARMKEIQDIVGSQSQFLIISTDSESIRFSAFKSYTNFQKTITEYVKTYLKKGHILEPPEIQLFPIADFEYKSLINFHRPLQQLLK